MKSIIVFTFITCIILSTTLAGWNTETTNWSTNPNPEIGDWGFDKPGYPAGLYIHGITVPEGMPVTNPVIYDNDIFDDVLDDEWMWAMTSLGKMNLVGVISTPVLTTFWPPFYRPDWEDSALESYENAVSSGMFLNDIEGIVFGSRDEGLQDTEGARLYIEAAHNTEPGKPLIVNMGGQSATLASAFLLDSTIAEKIIVYYTAINNYNGHYEWASEIIAQNFRVVEFYFDGPTEGSNWWRDQDCQNQWNVLPRPEECGAPKKNEVNSGEWAKLSKLNKPILNHFIEVMQEKPWFDPRNPDGHNFGLASDGYHDGTFIHAWAPDLFTAAQLFQSRGGNVLKITNFDESVAKEATLPIITNPEAYNGKPPSKRQ